MLSMSVAGAFKSASVLALPEILTRVSSGRSLILELFKVIAPIRSLNDSQAKKNRKRAAIRKTMLPMSDSIIQK